MDFQDRALTCLDCKNEFVFTAGEQEFFDRKGFHETPKRCKPCRQERKTRRPDRDARPGGAPDGNRPARELFDAICATCGAPTRVPFQPTADRPVYCRDCFSAKRQG